mgnify:CR=1 FL=1
MRGQISDSECSPANIWLERTDRDFSHKCTGLPGCEIKYLGKGRRKCVSTGRSLDGTPITDMMQRHYEYVQNNINVYSRIIEERENYCRRIVPYHSMVGHLFNSPGNRHPIGPQLPVVDPIHIDTMEDYERYREEYNAMQYGYEDEIDIARDGGRTEQEWRDEYNTYTDPLNRVYDGYPNDEVVKVIDYLQDIYRTPDPAESKLNLSQNVTDMGA